MPKKGKKPRTQKHQDPQVLARTIVDERLDESKPLG